MDDGGALGLVFQHADKALSGTLLAYFLVKLQPLLNKLTNKIDDSKESLDRLERQSDATQKDLIKLTERLKLKADKDK